VSRVELRKGAAVRGVIAATIRICPVLYPSHLDKAHSSEQVARRLNRDNGPATDRVAPVEIGAGVWADAVV
jgi:hypothetical protein